MLDGHAQQAMLASDAVLLATGTATLEAMLCKRPMVAAYKVAPFTYHMVKQFNLLKVDAFSLPNILSGQTLVPELMQDDCNPQAIADALLPMLEADGLPADTLAEYLRIHRLLKQDAARQAADAVLDLIAGTDR